MAKHKLPDVEIQKLIHNLYDECKDEDVSVRQRQLRQWRRLKLLWEGFQRVWYSDVAHDWRVWDYVEQSESDQSYYDKEVNVFRAYLESIIAALSVTVPGVICYPDDADNSLDLATAKVGNKIGQLIYRHNDASILWLHHLFINVTEGMTAFYNYIDKDEAYGTYEEKEYDDIPEDHVTTTCPNCQNELEDRLASPDDVNIPNATNPIGNNNPTPQMNMGGMPPPTSMADSGMNNPNINPAQPMPNNQSMNNMNMNMDVDNSDEYDPSLEECPICGTVMVPQMQKQTLIINRLVGVTKQAKSRVCIEVYGGMNVKVPNYAKNQKQIGYLIKSEEKDYTLICEEYDHLDGKDIYDNLHAGRNVMGGYDAYEMQMRLSPQYQGEFPMNVVTENIVWIRPSRYNSLSKEDANKLRKKYPHGIKCVYINDELACAYDECLDDHWTLIPSPMSDYVHFNPLGETITSIQEITNDIISLVLQTIEHGVGQTIADPSVFDFKAYKQTEVLPGSIMPSKTVGNKKLAESIFEFKTATLSGEILPFYQQVQSMGQLTSGALPSLFGGAIEGSQTASQYSMSRAQALQRLQNSWKASCTGWKCLFSKAIPAYIKEVYEDEREVEKNDSGNFVNTYIRRAELEGKIGRVELEASENLPLSQGQIRDLIKELLINQNPLIQRILNQPENIPIIQEALGLPDMFIPGEQDVENQNYEIQLCIQGGPTPTGDPNNPDISSVEIDPDFDNHPIHVEVCKKWIISDAGRECKMNNSAGYQNVLLHAKAHIAYIQNQQMQQQAQMAQQGAPSPAKPNTPQTKEAPITGESDVPTES